MHYFAASFCRAAITQHKLLKMYTRYKNNWVCLMGPDKIEEIQLYLTTSLDMQDPVKKIVMMDLVVDAL